MRFDRYIVTVKQLSIVSQIVCSPVVLLDFKVPNRLWYNKKIYIYIFLFKWEIKNNVSCPFSELLAIYDPMGWGDVILGTKRSNDADGNENVKKTIGLISKTITLQVHRVLLVHFFARFCTTTKWKCLILRFYRARKKASTQIHFFNDVLVAIASSDFKVPTLRRLWE